VVPTGYFARLGLFREGPATSTTIRGGLGCTNSYPTPTRRPDHEPSFMAPASCVVPAESMPFRFSIALSPRQPAPTKRSSTSKHIAPAAWPSADRVGAIADVHDVIVSKLSSKKKGEWSP